MSTRELKFRVYSPSQKHMGAPFDMIKELNNIDSGAFAEDAIFMQYTGLKDKNGVEIYEGDIINGPQKYNPVQFTLITIGTDDWGIDYASLCWNVQYLDESGFTPLINYSGYGLKVSACEVIGNIYQNPELLK